jgi:catechol 2,3-dioxygenase-like lactoylglutathione lyase family enzyme
VLADVKAFSSFAVDDVEAAKQFYGETLGLRVKVLDEEVGLMTLDLAAGHEVFIYPKPDFQPATFTVLNFEVDDIDASVDLLTERGVEIERIEGFEQDEKGIARGNGPNIAWFKDPAGNTLSVLEQP